MEGLLHEIGLIYIINVRTSHLVRTIAMEKDRWLFIVSPKDSFSKGDEKTETKKKVDKSILYLA